jgi:hypothetical protein
MISSSNLGKFSGIASRMIKSPLYF